VEAAGSLTYLDFWSSADGGPSEAVNSVSSVPTHMHTVPSAVRYGGNAGVRIKTHRERLQEEREREEAGVEAGVGGVGVVGVGGRGGSAGRTSPSSPLPPLEALDYSHNSINSVSAYGNNSSSGVGVYGNSSNGEEVGERGEREFQKQGGFALFDDIS
jgi:hypothetical protein